MKELMQCWTNRHDAKAAARILDAEEIPATIIDFASQFHTPRFRYGISVPDGHYKRAMELVGNYIHEYPGVENRADSDAT